MDGNFFDGSNIGFITKHYAKENIYVKGFIGIQESIKIYVEWYEEIGLNDDDECLNAKKRKIIACNNNNDGSNYFECDNNNTTHSSKVILL